MEGINCVTNSQVNEVLNETSFEVCVLYGGTTIVPGISPMINKNVPVGDI